MKRPLLWEVAAMVIRLKQADADVLMEHFPGRTKQQIQKALRNAGFRGLICCHRHGFRSYWTAGEEELPPPPKPKPKREVRARNSVFDLGGVLLPEWTGTRLSPLGGWDE